MSETDAEEAVESAVPDDVEGSLDEVDLTELLEDEEFVAMIGHNFGAAVGREFGAVVGRAVDDRLRQRLRESRPDAEGETDENESGGYLARLAQWLVEQVSDILEEESEGDGSAENGDAEADEQPEAGESEKPETGEPEDEDSEVSESDEETDQPEAGDEEAEPEAGEGDEEQEADDEAEGDEEEREEEAVNGDAEEAGDQDAESETDEQDAESEPDEQDAEEVFEQLDVDDTPESADELRDLSYRQLQSAAKKVGVKANLGRDELTEKVADQLGFDAEA